MDDRIRVSDAERDGITGRLREHFAEGRLTSAEFDERVSAALSAKTRGDLRDVMADLPAPGWTPLGPASAPAGAGGAPATQAWRRPGVLLPRPRGIVRPRLLPVALIALAAVALAPALGWLLFAVVRIVLLVWLVSFAAGIIATGRFAGRIRGGPHAGSRYWQGPRW